MKLDSDMAVTSGDVATGVAAAANGGVEARHYASRWHRPVSPQAPASAVAAPSFIAPSFVARSCMAPFCVAKPAQLAPKQINAFISARSWTPTNPYAGRIRTTVDTRGLRFRGNPV